MLSDEQLDNVAGGRLADRSALSRLIVSTYGKDSGSRAKVFDTSGDEDTLVARFFAQAGIDYRQNAEDFDQFKMNGEWVDTVWIKYSKERTKILEFFDSKLGIK